MQNNNIISVKKHVHETVELNNDYTLPDYIIDVRKLVSCDTRAVLHNIYHTDNTYVFEGEVVYTVLVICEDNSIKNLIYSEDFSINANADNCETFVHDCKVEVSSARLVSPRKINCKTKLSVTTKNNTEESTGTVYYGTGMPEAEYTIEKKSSKCEYLMFADEELKNQHASRDIELTSLKDEISDIVYCHIDIRISERKITDGKLFLRGETHTEILYETVNGGYSKHCDRYPFSDVIENKNDTSALLCKVTVSDIKASMRNNAFGEMKVVEIDYYYSIKCRYYTEKTAEVLTDVYSTEYDTAYKRKLFSAMRLGNLFSGSLTISDSCSIEELHEDTIDDIIDYNTTVVSMNVKPDITNRKMTISGDLKYDIIYKGEKCGNFSVIRPYKYEREYDSSADDIYCEYNVDIQSLSCSLDKGRILLNSEIYFDVMIAENVEYEYIQEVEFSECCSDNRKPVIIYYPAKEDTLWEIAKKYKITCKDIIAANGLDFETLENVKVLLLPRKKQKSVYNTII